jgi:dynein heavy chain
VGGKELSRLHKKLDNNLNAVVKLVRNELSPGERILLGTLVIIDKHNKEIVEKLRELQVKDVTDFDWLENLRYYIDDEHKHQVKMIDTIRDTGMSTLGTRIDSSLPHSPIAVTARLWAP